MIHTLAVISKGAVISERADIGKGWRVEHPRDCILLGPAGSRDAMLTVAWTRGMVRAATGCWEGALDDLGAAVVARHGDSQYGRDYAAVVAMTRVWEDSKRREHEKA